MQKDRLIDFIMKNICEGKKMNHNTVYFGYDIFSDSYDFVYITNWLQEKGYSLEKDNKFKILKVSWK